MSVRKSSTRILTALSLGWAAAAPAATACAVVSLSLFAATAAQAKPTGPLELAPDAPDTYQVVKGDTLWDISGKFLKSPWRWPEVWNLNREQIKDPHWIYPGDMITLDKSNPGKPRLRLAKRVGNGSNAGDDMLAQGGNGGRGNDKLSPSVRAEGVAKDAISTISMAAIAAFINRPLIVNEGEMAKSPRIVATQEGRVYLGVGDKAYARGITDDTQKDWHIYRPARALRDPDTNRILGWEALYLGTGSLVRKGDPATLQIKSIAEEIGDEDRLMAADPAAIVNFAPHAPDTEILGKIISVYRGVTQVGRNSVVSLNVGKQQGVEPGHVLSVEQTGRFVKDRDTGEAVKLPNESIGQLLVFRTFDNISYGLIVDAQGPISVGDTVVTP